MMTVKSTGVFWGGIVCVLIGILWLLNERLGIPRRQMWTSLVAALPYLWPIILMIIGSILIVLHINTDD